MWVKPWAKCHVTPQVLAAQQLRKSLNEVWNVLDFPRAILNHCRAAIRERWQLPAPFPKHDNPATLDDRAPADEKRSANVSQLLSRAKKGCKAENQASKISHLGGFVDLPLLDLAGA
jgi:hypothetical protein